jgi:probable F420-dependent oxidoreductase
MKFGVLIFPTDETIDPASMARATEERGFESLWFPEHTHIPTSRESPWPGGPELPRYYMRTYDPFIALTMAAAVTTTLKLGTGICLVVERDPIITAKEVASLDRLSNGRFLFGVGAGWNVEEMRNHGTDPSTRFALMEQRVSAMKQLWTEDEAEYRGSLVTVERSFSWPKPIQTPHPPIYVGGDGPNTLKRVVRMADAWMPIPGRGPSAFPDRIKELADLAAAAGRGHIPTHVFAGSPDPASLSAHRDAGADGVLFAMPQGPADEVLRYLDKCAAACAEFTSAL